MVPCATIEDIVKSIAFEDHLGLRATASTETEDYDRPLILELVKLRFDLIQRNIDGPRDTARGKFAGRADIDQKGGLESGSIDAMRELHAQEDTEDRKGGDREEEAPVKIPQSALAQEAQQR